MSELALVHIPSGEPFQEIRGFDKLRSAVLNNVTAVNSKRSYGLALDELSGFCSEQQQPVSRTLILEFRAAMLERELSPSTINVKLSAIRKLVDEAKRAGVLGAEEASEMSDIPNVRQNGTRLGTGLLKSRRKNSSRCPTVRPQREARLRHSCPAYRLRASAQRTGHAGRKDDPAPRRPLGLG